jgi:predicted nuclease of predicted toxin-antitoxin system
MKFLVDMNLSPRWIEVLNKAGFQAIHWSTAGKVTATDHEIAALAAKNDYIVVTHDLDFGAILAVTHGRKPSDVQIRADNITADAIGEKVIAAHLQMEKPLKAGALLTIDTNRNRMRLLPLDDLSKTTAN